MKKVKIFLAIMLFGVIVCVYSNSLNIEGLKFAEIATFLVVYLYIILVAYVFIKMCIAISKAMSCFLAVMTDHPCEISNEEPGDITYIMKDGEIIGTIYQVKSPSIKDKEPTN